VQDGDVRDWDVDGDAGVEVAAVVFGKGRVRGWEEDGAGDFVAGWHFVVLWFCGFVVLLWCKGIFLNARRRVGFVVFWER